MNVVLNPLLALGVAWGPISFGGLGLLGVGLATGVAWLGTAAGMSFLAARAVGSEVRDGMASEEEEKAAPVRVWEILVVGGPVAIGGVCFDLIYVFITPWITDCGSHVLAAIGVGHRLESIGYLLAVGIGHATATLVGWRIGAGDFAGARRAAASAATLATATVGAYGAVVMWFAEPIFGWFASDAAVIEMGCLYITIAALPMTLQALESVIIGAFEGEGNTLAPGAISFGCYALRVPLVAARPAGLAGTGLGALWVFGAIAVTAMAAGIVNAAYYVVAGARQKDARS